MQHALFITAEVSTVATLVCELALDAQSSKYKLCSHIFFSISQILHELSDKTQLNEALFSYNAKTKKFTALQNSLSQVQCPCALAILLAAKRAKIHKYVHTVKKLIVFDFIFLQVSFLKIFL